MTSAAITPVSTKAQKLYGGAAANPALTSSPPMIVGPRTAPNLPPPASRPSVIVRLLAGGCSALRSHTTSPESLSWHPYHLALNPGDCPYVAVV